MLISASVIALTATMSAGAADPLRGGMNGPQPATVSAAPTARASVQTPAPAVLRTAARQAPAWLEDRQARPAALTSMYATLGVLQALDIYSTRRALASGGIELNPAMRDAAQSSSGMLAAKALATAGSIYFAERAWKKNRKGAVILMAAINGVTAAVVANNLRQAR